jgi:hypothetical protein
MARSHLQLILVGRLEHLANAARRPAIQGAPRHAVTREKTASEFKAAAHGHTRYMNALFVSHSFALAHPTQLSSWLLHTVEQTCER